MSWSYCARCQQTASTEFGERHCYQPKDSRKRVDNFIHIGVLGELVIPESNAVRNGSGRNRRREQGDLSRHPSHIDDEHAEDKMEYLAGTDVRPPVGEPYLSGIIVIGVFCHSEC